MSEQTLTQEQLARLTQIISNEPEAMNFYIRYTDVEARLCKHHGSVSNQNAIKTTTEDILLEVIKIEEESRTRLMIEQERQRQLNQEQSRNYSVNKSTIKNYNHFVIPRVAALLSMAAMILVTCTIAYQFMSVSEKTANLINSSPKFIDHTTTATLTNSLETEWSTSSTRIPLNGRLKKGKYTLTSGIAEIVFDSGAKTIIQSPAQFAITGTNKCILNSGTLSAIIPKNKPNAKGFTVNTPDVEAVDIGTEFCLFVNRNNTELHVVDGQVDATLQSHNPDGNLTNTVSILQGLAKGFDRKNNQIIQLKYSEKKFHTRWSDVLSTTHQIKDDIQYVKHAPKDVKESKFENSQFISLILESTGTVLDFDLPVDIDAPCKFPDNFYRKNKIKALGGFVPQGTRITSYLLHLDPNSNNESSSTVNLNGSITFNAPIVGIILNDQLLFKNRPITRLKFNNLP